MRYLTWATFRQSSTFGTGSCDDSGVKRGVDELEQARESYAQRAWQDAYESLSRADAAAPLAADDLELLATSAAMTGRMDEYLTILERLHGAYLESGEGLRAARAAGWLGMNLAMRGELGPAGGWFGRAQRLVEREARECVEQGYLLLPLAFQGQATGDYDSAYTAAVGAAEIARALRRRRPPGARHAHARAHQNQAGTLSGGPRRCSTRRWSRSRPARCRRS